MAALMPLDASCTSSTVIGWVANREGDAIRLNLDLNPMFKKLKSDFQKTKNNHKTSKTVSAGPLAGTFLSIWCRRDELAPIGTFSMDLGFGVSDVGNWDLGKFKTSDQKIYRVKQKTMFLKLTRVVLIFVVVVAFCGVWPCAAGTASEPKGVEIINLLTQ